MTKFICNSGGRALPVIVLLFLMVSTLAWADSNSKNKQFTSDFALDGCAFSNTGGNAYFSLDPGTEIFLEGEEDGEEVRVEIYVTSDTKEITAPGVGTVVTRVIEEWEYVDDELVEVSYNWFARCEETNDIYYFGEEVYIYEYPDEGPPIITHEGAWRAGVDGALPGLVMPGTFLLGSRYYNELAPDIAMDRGENVAMGLTVMTPAGIFENCVKVRETTPLEPSAKDIKIYAPGDGLIVDEALRRVPE